MSEEVDPKTNQDINKGPVLRPHVYDGIQEYDQKLPNWWLFTFYIAIVFFAFYWLIYYSTDWLNSDELAFQAKIEQINEKKAAELKALMDKLDDDVLWQMSENSTILAKGEKVYSNTCISCHGPNLDAKDAFGNELSGRSLVDAHWEHGSEPMDLFKLIADGTPEGHEGYKGGKMAAWEPNIGGEAVAEVTAYLISKSPTMEKPVIGE